MHLKADLTELLCSNELIWLRIGYLKARMLFSYGYNITKDIFQQNVFFSIMVTSYKILNNLTLCLSMLLNTPSSFCTAMACKYSWMWQHTSLMWGRCAWLASAHCQNRSQDSITHFWQKIKFRLYPPLLPFFPWTIKR